MILPPIPILERLFYQRQVCSGRRSSTQDESPIPHLNVELLVVWPQIKLECPCRAVLHGEMPIGIRDRIGIKKGFAGRLGLVCRATRRSVHR